MKDEDILNAKKQKRMAEKQEAETDEKEEQLERELKMSIYDGIVDLNGFPTEFRRRMLADDKLSIYMPVNFEQVPEEDVKTVYVFGNPPQYMFTDTTSRFSIGFTVTEHNVGNAQLYDFAVVIRKMLKTIVPGGMKLLDTDKWNYEVYNMMSIEFISETLMGSSYNLMIFSSVSGKLVIGAISFAARHVKRLAPLAQEIAKSYQIHVVADMMEETETA